MSAVHLDFDSTVAQARANTGLHRFGDEAFFEPLQVLMDAINREAELTDRSMAGEAAGFVQALETRLKAQSFLDRYPEIRDEPMTAPVVIVGPQRSGTSKLYRLIASDPQWTKLYTWQAMFPVPMTSERPGPDDPRITMAERAIEDMKWLQPAHEIDARAPEMEAHITALGFMTNSPTRLVPTHERYCETADASHVYRWLHEMLQFIQWQTDEPRRRWILKSPTHLQTLDALVEQYPDATLVMTHRHPLTSVASMMKLVELAQANYATTVDRRRIRNMWLRILTKNMQNFLRVRDAYGDRRWVDVPYAELEGDSLVSVRRIYASADVEYSSATEAAIGHWEATNPQHKQGEFSYDLSDYGITAGDVEEAFAEYIDRFAALF